MVHTCDSKNELFGLSGIDAGKAELEILTDGNEFVALPIADESLLLLRAPPRVLLRALLMVDEIETAAVADPDAVDGELELGREDEDDDDDDDNEKGETFDGAADGRPPSRRRIAAAARSTESEMPRNA